MNPRDDLLEQIKSKAVVHGRVVLSSGREADYYVDLRRITLDADAAPLVGQVMLDATADLDFDAVGGLTLGADPVAAAMLHAAAARGRRLDAFVVRKEGKAHGLQRRIEGPDVAGRRVLAVEDTSTTGGSVLTAVEALHTEDTGAILAACRQIKGLEEEGDAMYYQWLGKLFEEKHDPITVITWKELYDTLEKTLDAAEDAANVLESVTIKHG